MCRQFQGTALLTWFKLSMKLQIAAVFEIGEKYADNIITGFILLDGVATGVIANRPAAKKAYWI